MKLTSRAMRDGEPIICAYGCRVFEDGAIRAGLLFVRERTPDAPVELIDARGTTYTVTLPPDFAGQNFDPWGVNEIMEAAE